MKYVQDFKKQFDEEIYKYLDEKIAWAGKIDPQADKIFKIVKEFIENGGRRFRPALFYYAYKSFSSDSLSSILRMSFVFEFLQTFALIHDDIIDQSDLRRNKPAVHKKYDTAIAIMAGDIALMMADEIFFNELLKFDLTIDKRKEIIEAYNHLKQETFVGEYLDYIKIADVDKIMRTKTSQYTFVNPAKIGFLLSGVDEKNISQWMPALEEMGVLYQTKDDFAGTFTKKELAEKSITSDFAEGKSTIIVELFKRKAKKDELNHFVKVFGKGNVKEEDFNWYLTLLKKYDIDKHVKEDILTKGELVQKELRSYFTQQPVFHVLEEALKYIDDFST